MLEHESRRARTRPQELPGDLREFAGAGRGALLEARAAREAFVALGADAPSARVVEAFDAIRRPLDSVRGLAGLYSQVHPAGELRDAAKTLEQELSAFDTELSLDRAVFERLSAADASSLAEAQDRRLLAHALRDYRRSGVDRDPATRARIQGLNEELVRIGQDFDVEIASDTRSIRIAEGRGGLEGLPQDYVDAHPEAPDGSVVVTTDPPDCGPFLSYAKRGDLRRRLYRELVNRAAPGNLGRLRELLVKRHELAQLLGHPSWADYVTEDKMIRKASAAREFIERVAQLARPRMLAEYGELLERKRVDEPAATEVGDWERGYYAERVRTERFGFDSQAVRPYFPYASVRDGVLATAAALYGVEFRRDDSAGRWDPAVECYDVLDSGCPIARFYLDMHPRPNKYKHAAMFHLRSGVAGESLPEAVLVCNFAASRSGDPALMQHRQVTTFFHEFGHLLHHVFGGSQRHLYFSGIATEWDFVEAPSQMFEEWAWDAGVLQRFARHHRTGAAIPAELVARMRAAEEYGKGLQLGQQMFYAALSLSYHDRDPSQLDLSRHLVELKRKMTPFPHEEGTHFEASFGHLHGYSAIYYTYMWSLVIAKDLFSRFEADVMDAEAARSFRSRVLGPGGTKDASELVRDFLGRDYGFEAWQRWLDRLPQTSV
jgi:Zn-dependent oligopeptidase